MTEVSVNLAAGTLSPHGKNRIARVMFERGKTFVRAAAHLRKEHGYEFVTLHLLCQGMEILLKSYLLFANFDKYADRLKAFRHDLQGLANTCSQEFGIAVGRTGLLDELNVLSPLYSNHVLRYGYGSALDFLVDPATIRSGWLSWRLTASIRLANRLLAIQPDELS